VVIDGAANGCAGLASSMICSCCRKQLGKDGKPRVRNNRELSIGQRSLSHFHAEFYLPDGLLVRIRMNADFLRLRLLRFVFGNAGNKTSIRAAATCFAATVNFLWPLCTVHPAGTKPPAKFPASSPFDCAPIKE